MPASVRAPSAISKPLPSIGEPGGCGERRGEEERQRERRREEKDGRRGKDGQQSKVDPILVAAYMLVYVEIAWLIVSLVRALSAGSRH